MIGHQQQISCSTGKAEVHFVKNNFMKRELVIDVIIFLFILLFLYASLSKLIDYQKFDLQIRKSPLLTPFAGILAILVPVFEIVISLALMIDRFRLIGLYAFFTLMTMFTAYIFVILQFSDYIPCSCGGILQNMNWRQHLVFDIVIVLLSMIAVFIYPVRSIRKSYANQ